MFQAVLLAAALVLGACSSQFAYTPGGDHSLATASQTMGPRNHASASIGQALTPNGY